MAAEIIVFHHVLGVTDGVRGFADTLRAAGHHVAVPDLFEGQTFRTRDEGRAYVDEVGFDAIIERGRSAAEMAPTADVFVGFSLGVLPAQLLAQTRPAARGAILCYACVPPSEFGSRWPDAVPVQVHAMADDELFQEDLPAARDLASSVEGAELFLYPGTGHLFADSSSEDYDQAAAELLMARVHAFLAACGP